MTPGNFGDVVVAVVGGVVVVVVLVASAGDLLEFVVSVQLLQLHRLSSLA